MPCNDVTELLELKLDAADQLASYRLIKKTCGRAVGEVSLLEELLRGQPAAHLLALSGDDFADAHPLESDEEVVLQLKHFFAVQAGLRALLGIEPAGPQSAVRVARVGGEPDGSTVLEAAISVDVLTEQIKACGRCKGCGSLAAALKNRS